MTLLLVTIFFFFAWILRNSLFWTALWQVKEYRFDRLFAHLAETSQGRRLLFSPFSFFKWLAIYGYIYVIFHEERIDEYQLLVAILYGAQFLFVFREAVLRLFRRPVLTLKAILVVVFGITVSAFLTTIPLLQQPFLWLLLVDRALPFVIGFFIFFLSFPTALFRDYQVDRATRKIQRLKKLVVIGVTGSYGKSSTKEFTAQILSKKFKVVKTPGTNNTPIGVANTILHLVKKDTEILVVEMGAYKRGEIAELCQIAQPKFGILTAVSDQHLSLFGSLSNVTRTKYELIESLPREGLALFNGNNEIVRKLYQKTKKPKMLYATKNSNKGLEKADILASEIVVRKDAVEFAVQLRRKKMRFLANLIGEHMIENILPGIFLADRFGMSEKVIKEGVAQLTTPQKTMVVKTGRNKAVLIDDTFNVNPDGVLSALSYMQIYRGKRILVMDPMIELGKNAGEQHRRVGEVAGRMCDEIFLTKRNFAAYVKKGVSEKNKKCRVVVANPLQIAEYLLVNTKGKNDIIVFEGKEAGVALSHML